MGCYRTGPVVISVSPGATDADIEALITEKTKGVYHGEIEFVRLCNPGDRPELLCLPMTPVPPAISRQPAGRNDPCPCGSGKKYKRCCRKE